MASRGPRMRNNTGVRIAKSREGIEGLLAAMQVLVSKEVLVGFPEETAEREPENGKKEDLTNPVIAYIHDNGAPEANIPQREFMRPGIESARAEIETALSKGMRMVLKGGGEEAAEAALEVAGFKAANGIKRTINEGIPPPLSDYTLRQRLKSKRRDGAGARKGAAQELDRRWDDQAPSVEFAKPLVDTGQLRNAVTYVVRDRKKGK